MTTLADQTTTVNHRRQTTIPLSRLVTVELRKLVDTRAGFWLAMVVGIGCVVVVVAQILLRRDDLSALGFESFVRMMNTPTGMLLPVMAVLLVTAEWGQRTAAATFTLEPRRERVLLAKALTVVITAIAAVVVVLTIAALGTVLAGLLYADPAGAWDFSTAGLVNLLVVQLFGLFLGFAFAVLILNTPGAIVGYFAVPTLTALATQLIPSFGDRIGEWVSVGATNAPFETTDWATGGEWARLLVSAVIWIGIPLTLGLIRVLRTEIK
ncbi:ABC transporter permease [Gordonia sp. NPDC003424]